MGGTAASFYMISAFTGLGMGPILVIFCAKLFDGNFALGQGLALAGLIGMVLSAACLAFSGAVLRPVYERAGPGTV